MANLSVDVIQRNYTHISERIEETAGKSGRSGDDVRIMAVTKAFPLSFVELSIRAGINLFGENRVLEADQKYSHLLDRVELHLIGHLQRNKAKRAVGLFNCVQSIDKLETAEALNNCAQSAGKKIDILIQVNTSQEESKSGYTDTEKLNRELEQMLAFHQLRVAGLMTIAELTKNETRIHACFAGLRSLFFKLKERFTLPFFKILSMGMSNDYQIAVEEGSTLVRIGTALYGAGRGYHDED
jgi:pyridoxal phosphate enzyme (YggS family)